MAMVGLTAVLADFLSMIFALLDMVKAMELTPSKDGDELMDEKDRMKLIKRSKYFPPL